MKSIRNHLTMGLLLLTLGLMLTACGKEGFKIENGKVYYTYWTFSFGQQNRELPGADPETFKSVNDWLGRDARHVYFKYRLAEGADPATVEAKKYPMFRDKNDYYIEGAALHVADMNTFDVLMHNDMHIWSKDSRYAYFDSTRIEVANIKQFKVVDWDYATDGVRVYVFGKMLPDSDPATFKEIGSCYYKDKNHVWFLERLVEGADPATFELIRHGYAKDKAHIYYDEKIVDADYATFTIDQYGDPRDKNGRIHEEKRWEDAPAPPVEEPEPEPEP
ncbi:MAG: DKNYY domain-containing protein [Muribaculaceae bacterium]|nr:DKNYY domain-containing protein [Muribaculaceae bacterium]